MFTNLVLPLGVLVTVTAWMAILNTLRAQQVRRQQEIASRGAYCSGRIVAIQRPFLLDPCTRLYFDFAPPGMEKPLRCCHIARPAQYQAFTDLPCEGALVTVHYLPERPHDAVIGKLIAS